MDRNAYSGGLSSLIQRYFIIPEIELTGARAVYDAFKGMLFYLLKDVSTCADAGLLYGRKVEGAGGNGDEETDKKISEGVGKLADWYDGLPIMLTDLFSSVVDDFSAEAEIDDEVIREYSNHVMLNYMAYNVDKLGMSPVQYYRIMNG